MPCEVETRLSRPTSAARLLPTISSPSLEDEGRNPVGRNDAARAARFAWMCATHAGRPAWNQSNCVTACLARTLQTSRAREAGSEADGCSGRAWRLWRRDRCPCHRITTWWDVTKLAMNGAGTARFI